MAKDKDLKETKPMLAIRKIAMQYPEVEETGVCVNRAFQARKKSYVFLGMNEETYNVRLKLTDSYPEAERLAKKHPENYQPGSHGWTKIVFSHKQSPPAGLMKRWIDESFRSLAPKQVVEQMSGKSTAKTATKPRVKKKTAKKKTVRKTVKKKTVKKKAAKKSVVKKKAKTTSRKKRS